MCPILTVPFKLIVCVKSSSVVRENCLRVAAGLCKQVHAMSLNCIAVGRPFVVRFRVCSWRLVGHGDAAASRGGVALLSAKLAGRRALHCVCSRSQSAIRPWSSGTADLLWSVLSKHSRIRCMHPLTCIVVTLLTKL